MFRKLARCLYQSLVIRPLTLPCLRRLAAESCPVAQAVGRALAADIDGHFSFDESDWISRIERLRSGLLSDRHEIKIIDYGAGLPDAHLTTEEMYRGRLVVGTVDEICRGASKSSQSAALLFRLIREIQPDICIELGTSLGISSCYLAAAMRLNGFGRIVTLEGSPALVIAARNNFQGLDLTNISIIEGRFQDTLKDVLLAQQPIDVAFIDGHHDERATVAYFEQILPALSSRALLVFDDITWSPGMQRAWQAITADARTGIAIEVKGGIGLCIVSDCVTRQWRSAIKLH